MIFHRQKNNSSWRFILEDGTGAREIKAKSIWHNTEKTAKRNPPMFELSYSGFQGCPRFSCIRKDKFEKDLGLKLQVAGEEDAVRYTNLFIDASFPENDKTQFNRTVKVDGILNNFFPITKLICVDLKTGLRREDKNYLTPMDPEIKRWILNAENRWRYVFYNGRDKENPEYIGYRPEE